MRRRLSTQVMPLALCVLGTWACSKESSASGKTDAAPPITQKDAGTGRTDAAACKAPSHLILRIIGTGGDLRIGTTGLGHGLLEFSSDPSFVLETVDCSDDCSECDMRGPVPLDQLPQGAAQGGLVDSRRCVNDTSKACASDGDCGEGGTCRFFLGPGNELAFDTIINPAKLLGLGLGLGTGLPDQDLIVQASGCSTTFFQNLEEPLESTGQTFPVQGRLNLAEGAFNVYSANVALDAALGVAFEGMEVIQAGCSQCVGDKSFYDGVEDGKCSGGRNAGKACDVHAVYPGGYLSSYDCPPTKTELNGESIEPVGVQLGPFSEKGLEWELEADSPDCGGASGKKCWCGICAEPLGRPCHVDRDCGEGGCFPSPLGRPAACDACAITDEEHGFGVCGNGTPCFGGDGVIGSKIAAFGQPGKFENGSALVTVGTLSCAPGVDAELMQADGGFDADAGAQVPLPKLLLNLLLGLTGPMSVELQFAVTQVGGEEL
ncbi:MAG: hypothetical protein KC416_08385 [Myxococcales bacterium]|nr:hypothetical protein [Myxococcales bacterium]